MCEDARMALYKHMEGRRSSTDGLSRGVRAVAGFQKVELACQQALEHDYDRIWTDTACIDKSSSAELCETINSMCTWDQKSAMCYVSIEDVPADLEAFLVLEGSALRTAEDRECLR